MPVIIHHHVEHPGQELQQPRCRLAVLPFLPTGNDDSDHPFSRSITKILIDDLARSSNLDVVAHISTSIFHGRHKDHHRIVKYLNVDAILEGDVLLSDTQLNITIRLMNARTGAALWTTNLDVGAHDLLKSAEEVSRSVIPIVGSLLKPTLNAS
ncbi:MAG TPA: hypothetical protein VG759_27810 [Candidatus Angelobacter sp.]|nr:hypothetical protein [Candidatus Angelobacter sp.]